MKVLRLTCFTENNNISYPEWTILGVTQKHFHTNSSHMNIVQKVSKNKQLETFVGINSSGQCGGVVEVSKQMLLCIRWLCPESSILLISPHPKDLDIFKRLQRSPQKLCGLWVNFMLYKKYSSYIYI